jgi:phage portal protein BeeE
MIRRLINRIAGRETRAVSGSGFTAEVIAARDSYISGRSGLGELTATVQGAVSYWEHGMALADVEGSDLLSPATLALAARALALRGEFVALVREDRLVPAVDWDVTTVDGQPRAYRLTLPDAGGGRTVTALAGEVVHVVIGSDPATPWAGTSPLRRASITAELLHALEAALGEVYADAPIGSAIVPYPESNDVDRDKLARSFRGRRGRVLLRESTAVTAAGGPTPQSDWRPESLSPDLSKAMTAENLRLARNAVLHAYGVLPSMMDPQAAGPAAREAQRHLGQWTLAPIARRLEDEATRKLGGPVTVDVMRPLQAYDAGNRARAAKGMVDALAAAREAGLPDDALAAVAKFSGTPSGGE